MRLILVLLLAASLHAQWPNDPIPLTPAGGLLLQKAHSVYLEEDTTAKPTESYLWVAKDIQDSGRFTLLPTPAGADLLLLFLADLNPLTRQEERIVRYRLVLRDPKTFANLGEIWVPWQHKVLTFLDQPTATALTAALLKVAGDPPAGTALPAPLPDPPKVGDFPDGILRITLGRHILLGARPDPALAATLHTMHSVFFVADPLTYPVPAPYRATAEALRTRIATNGLLRVADTLADADLIVVISGVQGPFDVDFPYSPLDQFVVMQLYDARTARALGGAVQKCGYKAATKKKPSSFDQSIQLLGSVLEAAVLQPN